MVNADSMAVCFNDTTTEHGQTQKSENLTFGKLQIYAIKSGIFRQVGDDVFSFV